MSPPYYKATRPDGTDFRTGSILYAVGATVTHPTSKRFGDMRPNDPGTYLSVSIEPGESLTGGSWPCRLFRVAPTGRTVARTDGQLPHKRGCRTLRVVEELPAHLALGPNGEAVTALIDRARRLTAEERWRLDAALVDAGRLAAWVDARDAARDAARHAAWDAALDAARDAAWDAAWVAARDAARDAARALLVRDLITTQQFDLLYGPWQKVIGDA